MHRIVATRAGSGIRKTLAWRLAQAAAALALLGATPGGEWSGVWTSAQFAATRADGLKTVDLDNTTLREIIRVSADGEWITIQFSNAFGRGPLTIGSASVAEAEAPGRSKTRLGTAHRLTFSGKSSVTLAPGASLWSDPVPMRVAAFTDLAVSLYLPKAPDGQTGHSDARSTQFLAKGDQTSAPDLTGATAIGHWYQLSAVAAYDGTRRHTIVAVGDSITDSYMSDIDGNNRWPDILAQRLHAAEGGERFTVVNQGLGGNRILSDIIGPKLLDRLDRDIFSVPGVKTVILLEGVNDLGNFTREGPRTQAEHDAFVARLIEAYRHIVAESRRRGIRIIGGTIMPYARSIYYNPTSINEADRQKLNAWIRTPGNFDAVIDFDLATRDRAQPDMLRAEYDSGDHIHPSVAGYRAMAEAVPIDLLLAGR